MSELREGRWAVLSARGREASGLAYAKAAELVRELKGGGLSGLCIVTDAAAARLAPAPDAAAATPPADNHDRKRPRHPATGRKGKTR
jgi:hypothetical protein